MIQVYIYRNKNNEIYGFKVNDHGPEVICSAVSMLTINAINSIENFTDEHFECNYDDDGGYMHFEIPKIKSGSTSHDAILLLNSLVLGLKSIKSEYGEYINIFDKEV